jgi:thymidylate synthase (FAD)
VKGTTMHEAIKVLDHGYIKLIETWGSDEGIVEAARMSTGKGFLGWHPRCANCGDALRETPVCGWSPGDPEPGLVLAGCTHPKAEGGLHKETSDLKLLQYLHQNHHDTPFEMAGMIVEVQAPIIVFREWHRHRVPWSYNEASARYAPLPALDFLPTVERLMAGGGHLTKQAGAHGDVVLTEERAAWFLSNLEAWQLDGERLYQTALADGVPKELARGAMSVFRFSKMRASANLRGWCHFLTLRTAPGAQKEIRDYANAASEMLHAAFPRCMGLFDDGRKKRA